MKNKAQSLLEYSVLIIIVAAALVGMQGYLKRGLQGRMRSNADELSAGGTYAPGATNSVSTFSKTIEEQSNSYTVKEDNLLGDVNETSISESQVTINQTTNRSEVVR